MGSSALIAWTWPALLLREERDVDKCVRQDQRASGPRANNKILSRHPALSEVQDLSPHSHSNIWKVRPAFGSNMLAIKRGCLPQRAQGGQLGFSIRHGNADLRVPAILLFTWAFCRASGRISGGLIPSQLRIRCSRVFWGSLRMSLQHLSDASITAFYENIRQQVEIDRSSKHRLTAGEAVRQRADELHNELMRRRLHSTPIKW
jgi:hypothetical protein